MSIEALKVVTQRLKPIDRKIRQILRIGKVSAVIDSNLNIQFSELEEIKKVSYLAINGLQIGPKVGDFVLVYSPEGRMEHAVTLAVVSVATAENEHEVTLSARDKTLGNILREIAEAIHQITSPGFFMAGPNAVTPGPSGTLITLSTEGFK